MAAPQTVPQHFQDCNFIPIIPRHGVVTLFGYGITVCVDRGHLTFRDGIGPTRREGRLSRVRHGLRRLVVVGNDGMISLAALRWIADQDASFVMLDRDGTVLATTGPVRSSDVRLRRAQALAHESGIASRIARELITQKLLAQEQLARDKLHDAKAAQTIVQARLALSTAETIQAIRQFESQAAYAYWSAWHGIPITFSKLDLRRVPDHWQTFGSRLSPLTESPRLAVNPPNAMLNYLYALLESEARLAAAALGLDPGLGFLHVDTASRDSLACDLMEPIRPMADAYLLDWISRGPFRREWFFEQRDGNCRLMSSLAAQLSETALAWRNAVAPYAERISKLLWSGRPRTNRTGLPPTRLTQSHRREVKGHSSIQPVRQSHPVPLRCQTCGTSVAAGSKYCAECAVNVSRENLIEGAKSGRVATVSAKAQALRSATQRRQAAALKAWNPSDKPEWLNGKTYRDKILPRLAGFTVPTIVSALAVSEPYATNIRAGRCIPHPRHWLTLARLVTVTG